VLSGADELSCLHGVMACAAHQWSGAHARQRVALR